MNGHEYLQRLGQVFDCANEWIKNNDDYEETALRWDDAEKMAVYLGMFHWMTTSNAPDVTIWLRFILEFCEQFGEDFETVLTEARQLYELSLNKASQTEITIVPSANVFTLRQEGGAS